MPEKSDVPGVPGESGGLGSRSSIVVSAGRSTGGWATCGSSAVWDPTGRLVTEAGPEGRELLVADLDPDCLRRARNAHPVLADLRNPSLEPRERITLSPLPSRS